MEKTKGRTEIAELGEFGLIQQVTSDFVNRNKSTLTGVGDDAAVIEASKDKAIVISTDMLVEGVDFDLTYVAPKFLGYKAVTKGISDIVAMNAKPEQITISLAVSSKISVEVLKDVYAGIEFACKENEVDLVGGDTTASINGLVINVTAVGRQKKSEIVYRSGARPTDLVCITGNLGAAYMGLQLLEREKSVLKGTTGIQPKFDGYEFLLEKYLKPRARVDIVESLQKAGILPTSMIDLSDGLASDVMQICKSSNVGVRLYLERIPIAKQTMNLCEEMHSDPVIAALNGGEDYEILFTIPLDKREDIVKVGCIDIVGYITEPEKGQYLITPDGGEIALKAQGFR